MCAECSGTEVAARLPAVGLSGSVPAFLLGGATRVEEEREKKKINGFFLGGNEDEQQPSESSSIGAPSSSSGEEKGRGEGEEEEEVQSKERPKGGGLRSFDSLEESLPIKRGLSNYFAGKSKSFASLPDMAAAASAKDLAKAEKPFNKRRRLLLACSRRASYSSLATSLVPPLLSREHAVEEEEEEESGGEVSPLTPLPAQGPKERGRKMNGKIPMLLSPRSFSLSDLQHAQPT